MPCGKIHDLKAPIGVLTGEPGMELLTVETAMTSVEHPPGSVIGEHEAERSGEGEVQPPHDAAGYMGPNIGIEDAVADTIVLGVGGDGIVDRLRNGGAKGGCWQPIARRIRETARGGLLVSGWSLVVVMH